MIEVKDFLENTRQNNIIIQRSLREIDTDLLVAAMLGMDEEERQIILRNMSQRASQLVLNDIANTEGNTSVHEIEESKAFFLQLLRRYSKYAAGGITFPEENDIPKIDVTTDSALVNTFYEVARYMRRFGPLSLEKLDGHIDHPLVEKGLELIIDGWDPILVRSVLERYRQAYLSDVTKKTQMILDGIESLMDKDVPEVTRERLQAFLQIS